MLKSIQAYFPSEDKAEIAKSLMVRYKTEIIEVSKLGNTGEGSEMPEDVPLVTGGFPVTGIAATGIGGGLAGGILVDHEVIDHSQHSNHVAYVLSTKVEEEDYDAILDIIKNNQGKL